MDLIFAKWILAAVMQLAAGTGLDFPILAPQIAAPAGISSHLIAEDVWVPPVICGPGQPRCTPSPGGFVGGKLRQLFCLERGVYTVELRLGMLPATRAAVDGRVWLTENAPGAPAQLLLEFSAERQGQTFHTGSVGIAVPAPTCYLLRYDATGPARVNQDPRITAFSIRR